jgi:hypothetical protein
MTTSAISTIHNRQRSALDYDRADKNLRETLAILSPPIKSIKGPGCQEASKNG